jgi:hypothetical protein
VKTRDKQLEITVRWQGLVIRVERYEADDEVTLNGKSPLVTVPLELLRREVHRLVTICDGDITVHLLPSMQTILNDVQITDSNRSLELDDALEISLGPFWFQLRCAKALKAVFSVTGISP